MLSKSRGHVLRLAAVIHMLGYIETPDDIPEEISESALKAAINVVKLACQQTAFIAGKGILKDDIESLQTGE